VRNVIAIDGPAGAGKSTIAQALAARLSLPYLDTGAMYRGITYAAMQAKVDIYDTNALAKLARRVELDITDQSIFVDDVDATSIIRSPEVTTNVSIVAANSGVRAEMRAQQRLWVEERGGGVVEGRDIATVVFPDAILKIFLTASPIVRATRRVAQSGGDINEIAEQIAKRDKIDSNREDSPLREHSDSLVVDTSDLTVDEVVDSIHTAYKARLQQ
jgi:cytidylate kinase